MKILLINPAFPDTYWSFRHALPFEGKRAIVAPLPLMTVAALFPQAWQFRLVDLNIEQLRSSDIEWADMICITAMIVQKPSLQEVMKRCKAMNKLVLLGGPYVSTASDEELERLGADYLFKAEAERTIPQFVKDLAGGAPKRVYDATAEKPQMSESPIPRFDLAKLSKYSAVAIQYSRGCPFSCEFCDIIEIYGRVPRTKSSQQVLAELDALRKLGYRGTIFMVDDNFIGNKKNVRELMPALVRWQEKHGHPFHFITEASLNLADDQPLLDLMRQAGFCRVFVGIETPVAASLAETQKSQNRGNLLDQVRIIQSYGIEVMAGFIIGFDNDPPNIAELMIDFIKASGISLAMVGALEALPGTQLWQRLDREGRLLPMDSHGVDNTKIRFNFKTRLDPDFLIASIKRVVDEIYSPDAYYGRSLESLRRTAANSRPPTGYGLLFSIVSLARIIWGMGILDPDRKEFWKYFFKSLLNYPSQAAAAMRFAVCGFHFKFLTRKILAQ